MTAKESNCTLSKSSKSRQQVSRDPDDSLHDFSDTAAIMLRRTTGGRVETKSGANGWAKLRTRAARRFQLKTDRLLLHVRANEPRERADLIDCKGWLLLANEE